MNMDDAFKIEYRGDHVHVQFGPSYTAEPEWQNELWDLLRKFCDGHDTRRILAEGVVPAPNRPLASLAEGAKKAAVIPNLWIAFHFDDYVRSERTELYEAVAASEGVRVKFFNDSEHALNWLRANSPK
jgi:hypothetical protein